MKKLISLILALALVLSLAACGEKEEQGIAITNNLGWNLEEIYIVTAGAEEWGDDPAIGFLEDGVGAYLYPESAFGSREIEVDILAIDQDGDRYEAYGVPMKDGDSCSLALDDNADFVVYVGESAYYGEWIIVVSDDPVEEPPVLDDGSAYWGTYRIDGEGLLTIFEDGTFQILDDDGEVYFTGVCEFEDGVTLINDEDGERIFLVLDEDHNLYGGEDVGTLFRIDPNEEPVDEPNYYYDEADFEGYWLYSNGYVLEISDGAWWMYDDGGRLFQYGPVEFEGSEAWLMNEDGSSGGGYIYFDEAGNLIESGEMLIYSAVFPYGNSEDQANDLIAGEWYYSDQEYILYFDGVDTYVLEGPELYQTGTYSFGGEYVIFYDEEGEEIDTAYLDEGGWFWLTSDDSGNWFYRNE